MIVVMRDNVEIWERSRRRVPEAFAVWPENQADAAVAWVQENNARDGTRYGTGLYHIQRSVVEAPEIGAQDLYDQYYPSYQKRRANGFSE